MAVWLWKDTEDWRSLAEGLLLELACCCCMCSCICRCHDDDEGPVDEEEGPPNAELEEVAIGMAPGGPEARMGRKEGEP